MKTQDYTDEEFTAAVANFERGVEHARLKEAVIETAKAWAARADGDDRALWDAAKTLNEFEAAQNLGKQE